MSLLCARLLPGAFASAARRLATRPTPKTRAEIVKERTPAGKHEEGPDRQERHRDAEKEPLPKHPGGVNPDTGEKGGPAGPDPTRYGDWERKGRTVDF